MAYCYYTCNLLPLDLLVRAGHSPRWLGEFVRGRTPTARRDALSVHPLTCPYVTKLLPAAEEVLRGHGGADGSRGEPPGAPDPAQGTDCLVVPGGCDAMRRLGDLLAATYPNRVHVVHIPRASSATAVARLSADLRALEQTLTDRVGSPDTRSQDEATDPSPSLDYTEPPRPGGVFVVSGPLSDDSLLQLILRLGSHISGLESCTSPDRWKPLAPAAAEALSGAPSTDTTPRSAPDYEALAELVLTAGMCPRRSTIDRRAHLERRFDESEPTSIIYARQSFCDPGAYDALLVAELARERGLPFLEIEVDFPFDANGPLRTRVEAFLEAQLLDDDLLDVDELFEEV